MIKRVNAKRREETRRSTSLRVFMMSRFKLVLLANDGFVAGTVERVAHPADHHLFPRLIAPTHFLLRIGIELVLLGVVEVRDAVYARSLWHGERLFQRVVGLPGKVVFGDRKNYLRRSIGCRESKFEVLP